MPDLYAWPQVEKELYVPVDREVLVHRHKNTKPQNASHHHYHEVYELYYLYEGDRLYYIEGKTYRVPKGSFVLIRPYEMHSTGKASPTGYDRYLLHFSRAFAEKLSLATGFDPVAQLARKEHIIPIRFGDQGFVEELLAAMVREYEERPQGYEHFLQASVVQLFLILSRNRDTAGISEQYDADTAHRTVSAAVAYIHLCYAEPLSLQTIAERFFVSPGYFSHAFKAVTGVPFVKYVNGVRIREAQRLLQDGGVTVAAVAEAVGYKSVTHFGRVFKEITSRTPQSYKSK